MPSRITSNDRKEIEELCARRKKDYALVGVQKGIFPRIDEDCLKKPQDSCSLAELRRKLKFRPCPAGTRNSTQDKRFNRPLTPLGEFSKATPFYKLKEEDVSPESSSEFEAFDPDRFVIGSPPKGGRKTPSCREREIPNASPPNAGRKTPSCRDRDIPRIPDNTRPLRSLEIRDNVKPMRRPTTRTREPSVASELDPDLLETSDDEDEIFHSPYPTQFRHSVDVVKHQIIRTESYRQPLRPTTLEVSRETSVPSMSAQVKMTPQPSRSADCSVDCMRIKPWGFRWAANKICRSAVVKHN